MRTLARRNPPRDQPKGVQDPGLYVPRFPLSFTRVHPAEHDVAGLTDYEVRDVNDDINKLLREKRHWENQIIALGGANYRRNVAMLDDDGKEVPGTKGYKSVPSPPPFPVSLRSP